MEKKMVEESIKKAKKLMTDGDLVGAKEEIEAILAKNPSDERALNLLGMVYFKLGNYRKSAEVFEKLLEANPGVVALCVNAGLSHLKTGNFEKALQFFEKALEINPTNRNALNYAGYSLAKMGRYEDAKEMFLRAGSTKMVEEMNKRIEESGRPIFEETTTGEFIEDISLKHIEIEENYITLNIKNHIYVKIEDVLYLSGNLEMQPVKKKFQKQELKSPFKTGGKQLYSIRGKGEAILKAEKNVLRINLNGEMWVNEDFLTGFGGDIDWENARISTGSKGYVNVVRLEGKGEIFLESSNPIKKLETKEKREVMIKPSALVGWSGNFTIGEVKTFNGKDIFLVMKGHGEIMLTKQ